MKTIAFFNNKGGVGKTTLVYHLACMIADRGETVLAVDLDPQANLTSMFLTEDELELLWPDGEHPKTIFGALRPVASVTFKRRMWSKSTLVSGSSSGIWHYRRSRTNFPTLGPAATIRTNRHSVR